MSNDKWYPEKKEFCQVCAGKIKFYTITNSHGELYQECKQCGIMYRIKDEKKVDRNIHPSGKGYEDK